MKSKVFTREELYNLVWSKSLKEITEEFLVSYHSFKRICKDNQIPLPPQGHWSKKRFGKESPPPPLPVSDKYENINLYIRTQGDKRDLGSLNYFDKRKIKIENDPLVNLKVPKKLPKKLDPIVSATKSSQPVNHPRENGIWDFTKRYSYGKIAVSASEKVFSRALRIIHTLVKAIKARGHSFSFIYNRSYIVIDGIELAVRFRERHKRIIYTDEYGHRSSKLEPIGLITLITGEYSSRKEWNESENLPLEEKLSQIITWLEIAAEEELRLKTINDKIQKERLVQEKLEQERAEIRKAEVNKLKNLIAQSRQW
ncbi:hypothetical protein HC174_01490 [Salinimicrobium sp. CDJ15-81-2]|nr:hypothetical protein [Salinimicrobium nanhaiense]